MTTTRILKTPWIAATTAAATLALSSLPAHAVPTVWNVNIGGELTPSDNFVGAAPENTANSTWNSLGSTNLLPLVDSTGAAGTATIQLGVVGGTLGFTGNGGYLPEIFTTWCKHTSNTLPVAVNFGGLTPSATYDLIVYADWFWQGGAGVPITQTTGTGMSGTVTLNNFADANGTIHTLVQDTDLGNNNSIRGNWLRITGLTPSAGGILAFDMNGRNAPLSGFQLIQMTAGVTDTTPPTLVSFEHNKGAGPILVNEPVTYTVTFSEAMTASTVNADDFGNTGTAVINIDSVTPTADPTVFLVGVTPTAAGTLQFQINAGATLTDLVPLSLVTTSAISDDSTLTVQDLPPTPTTITVASSANPSTYGQNVTFTATVSPIPSGGTVQFYDGVNYLGTPVAVNTTTGEATYSTNTLTVGTYDINAEYSGNFAFTGSTTTAPTSQVVDKAPLTVKAQDVTRTVNTPNPDPLPYQITGYQNGENFTTSGVTGLPALSTSATLSSPVGPYTITCTEGTLAASNYSFTTEDGTLKVTNLVCPLGVLNLGANGGINPTTGQPWAAGDKYRLIFVTNGATETTSTDISTYNTFVQNAASASTAFPNLGSVTWKVVGSTATVNARDNTSTNPGVNGVGEPIVRMDGTFLIANNYADLWNGIVASHVAGQNFLAVHLDENNVSRIDERVRTGTNPDGTAHGSQMLGSAGNVQTGRNYAPNNYGYYGANSWMADWNASGPGRVYALSEPITLQVVPSNTFTAWANTNAPGQTPDQDHDNDGVDNGVEYFMGQTGSSFTAMPSLDASNTVTWTMDANYQGTYEVQTSPDLVTWTNVDPKPAPSGGTLSYTLPTGAPGGKSFVRLLVTPTP